MATIGAKGMPAIRALTTSASKRAKKRVILAVSGCIN